MSVACVLDKCARRMAAGAESGGPTTAADATDVADRDAGRVSVLNRREFCRRQNIRSERRRNYGDPRGTARSICAGGACLIAHGRRHG